jgi:Ca-activated chloride channel family protein
MRTIPEKRSWSWGIASATMVAASLACTDGAAVRSRPEIVEPAAATADEPSSRYALEGAADEDMPAEGEEPAAVEVAAAAVAPPLEQASASPLGAHGGDGLGAGFGAAGTGAPAYGRGAPGSSARPARVPGALGAPGILGAPPRATPPRSSAPLPQSGVLASTFVGGSGAQARLDDLLDRGVMVGGRQVRLEAFDELGRLPYAVPSDDAVAVYATLERERLVTDGERVHLQIALMARQGEMPARPRMDVRLVVDRSGSMSGEKWANAIAAAHELVDHLRAGDTFGLVSYSDSASVDLAPARVGNRRAAHSAIDRLEIGGGTNIDSALELVQASPPSRRHANDVLLVVLLSDGVANVGQTNPDMIASRARSMFDASGVLTTSIGVGTDFDETTMLSIAREGSGSYHFVRRSEDIARILTDELEERAQAVAQDLRLRIELAPGVVATHVYGSRILGEEEAAAVRRTEVAVDQRLARELGIARDRQEDDQRGLRMHFPTFRRGDQHVVLMELAVPPGTDRTALATVSLDWKDLVRGENDHARVEVAAERTTDAEAAVASTSRPVKRTVLAFQAGEALQLAAQALEHGDSAGARVALGERIELLRAASQLWRDRELDHDLRILEQYQDVVSGAWPGWGDDSRHTLVLAMNYFGDRRMQ